ncbi:hypothetical protein [Borreliella valaisiana]|nr:hypothetical protein KJD09_05925 [Borreliella valaisiana]
MNISDIFDRKIVYLVLNFLLMIYYFKSLLPDGNSKIMITSA